MRKSFFFKETASAVQNLTALINESATALISMWNVRCQVVGLLKMNQNLKNHDLAERFSIGSGIRGVQLESSFIRQSWEEQQSMFSWVLLNAACSVFEGWLAHAPTGADGDSANHREKQKKLQRPNEAGDVLRTICVDHKDLQAEKSFYKFYSTNKKNSLTKIGPLLCCYRVFKEMWNCYMHNACRANDSCYTAYTTYKSNCSKISLGVTEIPIVNPITRGDILKPVWRGVVGLTDIVIRLIITYDAEFSKTIYAKDSFLKRFESENGKGLTFDFSSRIGHKRFRECVSKTGVVFSDEDALRRILVKHGYKFVNVANKKQERKG